MMRLQLTTITAAATTKFSYCLTGLLFQSNSGLGWLPKEKPLGITAMSFTSHMPFLSQIQQCRSTEFNTTNVSLIQS